MKSSCIDLFQATVWCLVWLFRMFLIESVMFLSEVEFTLLRVLSVLICPCMNIDVYNEELYVVRIGSLEINKVQGELELVHFVGTLFSMYIRVFIYSII